MATKKKDKSVKLSDTAKKKKSPAGKKKSQPQQTKKIENVGPPVEPATASVGSTPTAAAANGMIFTLEDDPMSISVRQPIQVPAPTLPTGSLCFTVVDAAPPAELHPIGTRSFRYWVAAEALTRGIQFWQALLPSSTGWATPDKKLIVHLDMGVDLNAYYRRRTGTLLRV